MQDGRIHIEMTNWPFLQEHRGSPAEYKAGLDIAIERGWLWLHESGTYVKFTQAGSELFSSFPNEEAFLPLFIDKDHLRGIFHVFDRDKCCEIAGFPFPVFADDVNAAVTVDIVGAAH